MQYCDGTLTFQLNHIFEYKEDGSEKTYPARIEFTKVDMDDCEVLIFDRLLQKGKFKGMRCSLRKLGKLLRDGEFEIIEQAYYGYNAMWMGWLHTHGKNVSAIIKIYAMGNMIYVIDK